MKARYWIIVTLYCAGIFWLSSQSKVDVPAPGFPGVDKVAHALLFGGLTALLSVGLRRSGENVRPVIQIFAPIIFVAIYGLSDEIHQLFVTDRSFELLDWAADITGACLVQWGLCGYWWRISLRRPQTVE